MVRLLLLPFFNILFVTVTSGQAHFLSRALPTNKKWTDFKLQYNSIPTQWLRSIETELDSTISSDDCYKFMYNSDTTKFIAFFIMRRGNPKFNRLTHFGQVVTEYSARLDEDSILFLGYILWGMNYENNWYYDKDYETEFGDKSDDAAKNDFLFYSLSDIGFLKKTKTFWKNGGEKHIFGILSKSTSYMEEYIGLPEIVGWHKTFQKYRQSELLNEKIELIACSIEDNLWDKLHRVDSITFHTRYHSKYLISNCLVLYNSDRTNILLPILYYDNNVHPWVSYYYLKINATDTLLYMWTKFPTKKIDRKPGDESLEIIYDIRTLMKNWSWGTVNMISNKKFWNDNFKEADLKLIKE